MRKRILLWSAFFFCVSGCATPPQTPVLPAPEFVTATLPPTSTPVSSATSPLPTAAPAIEPVAATTTSEVNVREKPSTASLSLGALPPFTAIQVEGSEAFGYWLRILFDGGSGWVRADYVQASAEIPVLGAESGSGSGLRGAALRGVNVRSRPGRDFDSLGLLNQYDVVEILARDASGGWLQIEFPPAPDGTGWVAAEFLETGGIETLPVAVEEGQPTETDIPAEPASPAAVLPRDGDSADAPLAIFTISSATVRSIRFQGWVSTAGGDAEDWVGFSAGMPRVRFEFLCDAQGVRAELVPATAAAFSCGAGQILEIEPNVTYLIKIVSHADGAAKYEIRIAALP